MKKIFLIVLASIMVLGFAASAFAIHAEIPAETQAVVAAGSVQITLGGEIRTRGWWNDGYGSTTWNDTTIEEYYVQTENGDSLIPGLTTETNESYVVSKLPTDKTYVVDDVDVWRNKAHVRIDEVGKIDSIWWDRRFNHQKSSFTRTKTDTQNSAWWDERVRLWVDAKVSPNVTGYVQIESTSGVAGDKYVWGNGEVTDSNFYASNGAGGTNTKPDGTFNILQAWIQYSGSGLMGFPAGFKIGHMPLKLAYGQFFDNSQYGDDALVLFASPVKGLEMAALTFKGYEGSTANNHDDLDAYVGLVTYKWNDQNTVGVNYTYINSNAILGDNTDLKLQNLGLHADGNVAGFGYQIATDFQFGSVGANSSKADFNGYAVSAKLNYDLNTVAKVPVNLRGSFVMGSGDNKDDDNIKEFVPFVGNIQNYTFIYEYQITTAAYNPSGLNSPTPIDGHASGVANTTYYNLGVDFNATKDLSLSADGYLLRATKTFNGDSKTVGWELDAKLKYALAKNLTYQIDAGYFDAGNFYKDAYGVEPKSVTSLRHMLTLSF